MYPEYESRPAELDAFERTRTGAVVPHSMAEKFGWKVGDKIPIEADIWPQKDGSRLWVFDLVGTYRVKTPTTQTGGVPDELRLLRRSARSSAQGSVGWFVVRVADPARAAEVASAIDERFANSSFETRTATEAEFQRQFANQLGRHRAHDDRAFSVQSSSRFCC